MWYSQIKTLGILLAFILSTLGSNHRVIMYYIYREQGNMLSYILWPVFRFTSDLGGGEGGGRYFCRLYLAIFSAVLIATTIVNKHRIKHNLHFWLETNLQKWMYFNTPWFCGHSCYADHWQISIQRKVAKIRKTTCWLGLYNVHCYSMVATMYPNLIWLFPEFFGSKKYFALFWL